MGRPQTLRISPFEKFGLGRHEAAGYVNKTLSAFDRMVVSGEMPPPRIFGGEEVWVRTELEAAILNAPRKAPKVERGGSIYELVGR